MSCLALPTPMRRRRSALRPAGAGRRKVSPRAALNSPEDSQGAAAARRAASVVRSVGAEGASLEAVSAEKATRSGGGEVRGELVEQMGGHRSYGNAGGIESSLDDAVRVSGDAGALQGASFQDEVFLRLSVLPPCSEGPRRPGLEPCYSGRSADCSAGDYLGDDWFPQLALGEAFG